MNITQMIATEILFHFTLRENFISIMHWRSVFLSQHYQINNSDKLILNMKKDLHLLQLIQKKAPYRYLWPMEKHECFRCMFLKKHPVLRACNILVCVQVTYLGRVFIIFHGGFVSLKVPNNRLVDCAIKNRTQRNINYSCTVADFEDFL